MVDVARSRLLSDLREQTTYRRFPEAEYRQIESAVEAVPDSVFLEATTGREIRQFDAEVASRLPGYEHEHDSEVGRNERCKLWANEGYDHSVDVYHPDARIAIEIEKSERKRVSDDVLKFIKGGKTQRDTRKKIEFGCLIVPTNYRGSGNIYQGAITTLEFMRSILFVEDVAVIGYRDPRWP